MTKIRSSNASVSSIESHRDCGNLKRSVSTRALADKYLATGEATEADIDQNIRNTNDDHFLTIYYFTVSVVATH